MASRTFIDTNVFVYSVDSSDPEKQARAQKILTSTPGVVVSTQVMNEFFVVATRKLASPMRVDQATAVIERMARLTCVPVDATIVLRAIRAGQRWQLSHWDALMLEAARQAACDQLFTEDLAEGASYDGIQIVNPFRA